MGASPSMSPGAPRPGRRRSRRLVCTRGIGAIVGSLVVGVGAGIGLWLTPSPQRDPAWPGAESTIVVPSTGAKSALGDETRPNYRYSIVKGGVHASIEMRQAIERDSVVAAHYAGLDPSQFRVERLPVRTEAHVSYRIGQEVFWTRKKLVLPAGEKVLTDGTNIIRARCGNRVSMEELGPDRRQEPANDAFEQMSEPAVVAAEPPMDLSHPGAVGAPKLQSLPLGGLTGDPTYWLMVFGPGWDSRSNQSGTGVASKGLGLGSDQASISDPGLTSGSGLGGYSGLGPGPGLDPWPDAGLHPGSGLYPGSGLDPGPGLHPGSGLNEGPGSPLPTRTPIPTPEPSTMVLTGLGAAGLYLARVRQRSRARRTPSNHASR